MLTSSQSTFRTADGIAVHRPSILDDGDSGIHLLLEPYSAEPARAKNASPRARLQLSGVGSKDSGRSSNARPQKGRGHAQQEEGEGLTRRRVLPDEE